MADAMERPAGATADAIVDEPAAITAPRGASPARASQPQGELDHTFHAYEENPAPWWLALLWVGYLVGGAVYLVRNLMP